jgi:ABC-type branched-subunit amino acid transport system substrate-binding protein
LVENSPNPLGFISAFKENFRGTVVELKFGAEEKDFAMLAKQAANQIKNADYLFFIAQQDVNNVAGLSALDKEGILQTMKGRIAGTESFSTQTIYEALGEKINGIKTTRLMNLSYFSESGQSLAEFFQKKFTIQSEVFRMILGAEVMDLTIEAIEKVGNNAEAIKDYFTALDEQKQKSGYFGEYYFNDERTAEGLGFLVYELQDGELVAVE